MQNVKIGELSSEDEYTGKNDGLTRSPYTSNIQVSKIAVKGDSSQKSNKGRRDSKTPYDNKSKDDRRSRGANSNSAQRSNSIRKTGMTPEDRQMLDLTKEMSNQINYRFAVDEKTMNQRETFLNKKRISNM